MFVQSSRFRKQFEYLSSKGIDPKDFFIETGITSSDLSDSEKTFSLDQFISLLEYALEQTGDLHYGMRLGKEPHLAGTIGMMCASCKNLKEAFIQGCKYFSVQGDFASIKFVDDEHYPRIRYSLAESWILKSPETARNEVETMFSFLVNILQLNSNHTLLPFEIHLISQRPVDVQAYVDSFGVEPVFAQDENEIVFRGRDLAIPMKAFNPETFEILRSHIENQLKKYSGDSRISEKVKSILLSSLKYSFPDITTVASKLNMSSRTLQRQLSNENTSYKALLQDTRSELAQHLLKQKGFTISEISYMLGYSDLGNFSRSFKNYMGCTPQEFRKQ